MTTGTIVQIAKDDLKLWDGATSTFSRKTSTGGTASYNRFDWVGVDVFQLYGGRTRSALLSALSVIGTSSPATLFLSPGTWDIDDDITLASYPNIYLNVAPGAQLSVDSGKTLTIYSPANIIAQPNQQIFTGSGSIAFTTPGTGFPGWWGFSADATGANNRTYLQAAVTALGGGVVKIPAGNYPITTTGGVINVDTQFTRIEGDNFGGATQLTITGNTGVFLANSSATTAGAATKRAIDFKDLYFYHATADETANTCTAIEIRDVQKHRVENCRFAYFSTGIALKARDSSIIEKNWFTSCAYGIKAEQYFTSASSLSLQDVTIDKNVFEGCSTWGIYFYCDIFDLWISNAEFAMGAGTGEGIYISTGYYVNSKGVSINNSTYENFSSGKKCIFFDDVTTDSDDCNLYNVSIRNARFLTNSSVGVVFERCTNVLMDTVEFGQTAAGSGTAYTTDSNCQNIRLINCRYTNTASMPTVTQGSVSVQINAMPTMLYKQTASVNTSGDGEDELGKVTIRANSMGISNGVRVTAAGTKTGANGNKTLKIYFGTASVTFNATANDTTDWRVQAEIFNYTDAAKQRIAVFGLNGTTIVNDITNATEDTTADVVLKITGECANAGDTITQNLFIVERFGDVQR